MFIPYGLYRGREHAKGLLFALQVSQSIVGVHRIVVFIIWLDTGFAGHQKKIWPDNPDIPDILLNIVNMNVILILAIKLYDIFIHFQR